MRSGILVLVVAHLLASLTAAPAALAETAKPSAKATTRGEHVNASDLALGQPAPTEAVQSTQSAQSTQPAQSSKAAPRAAAQPASTAASSTPPPTTVAPPAATAPTVTSPTLASTAVIADGVQTTAVVDIRLLPKRLPYRGEQAIDGYVLDERRRWWMIVAGGVLFGIGYVGAIIVGNEHDFDNGFGFSPIPVAGPLITLAARDEEACAAIDGCEPDSTINGQLALTGLMQLAGAVLLPIGLTTTRQVWLRQDLAVALEPTRIGSTGYGAVLSGTF